MHIGLSTLTLFCYACLFSMLCLFFCAVFNLSSFTSPLTSASCVASSLSVLSLWRSCSGSRIPKTNAEGTAQEDRATPQPGSTSVLFPCRCASIPAFTSLLGQHCFDQAKRWTNPFMHSHEIAQHLYADFHINLLSCCSWNISFHENPKH